MDLEKILQEKQTGTHSSEQSSNQDQEQKLKNMQYQNDLLMERMNQMSEQMENVLETTENQFTAQTTTLNAITEHYQKKMNAQMQENEEKQENVMKAWRCKADELKESNMLLEKSFKQAIKHEIDDVLAEMKQETSLLIQQTESQAVETMQTIKESSTQFADDAIQERMQALEGFESAYEALLSKFDKQAAEKMQTYQESLNKLDQTTHDMVEKQGRNNHIFENGKFLFSNATLVVIAVVLIRALFFGIWEGLYVSNLYEWGSQWEWLKYTMWGLFALIIGATAYYVYLFLKNNLKRP